MPDNLFELTQHIERRYLLAMYVAKAYADGCFPGQTGQDYFEKDKVYAQMEKDVATLEGEILGRKFKNL